LSICPISSTWRIISTSLCENIILKNFKKTVNEQHVLNSKHLIINLAHISNISSSSIQITWNKTVDDVAVEYKWYIQILESFDTEITYY